MPVLPFIPLIASGAGALAGVLGNSKGARTSTQNTTENISGTSTPTYAPGQLNYINQIQNRYSQLLGQDPNLTGYQAAGQQQINQNSDIGQKTAANIAAAHGISGPAALSPILNQESQRLSQSSQFANSIPLLARQQMLQNLQAAGGFATAMPHGTSTTGTQTTNATGVAPGSAAAGGVGNLTNLLSYFAGKGNLFPGGGGGGGYTGTLPGQVTAGDSGGQY